LNTLLLLEAVAVDVVPLVTVAAVAVALVVI
jgi:hypothetical protein